MRRRQTIGTLGRIVVFAAIGIGLVPLARAELAASIEYTIVPRPAGLEDGFVASGGASLEFLSIKAIDGTTIAGALWQPPGKAAADTTLIVMIHGSGGDYHAPPQSTLPPLLAAKGYASLAIDTRQHDDKINTDNFMDIRRDIDAAVQVGRALGYRQLVLQGHSLGNIQVQFYAATSWDADIKAVMLLGPFGNLPWKSQTILVHDDATFKSLVQASLEALRAGKADQLLPIKMPYNTGADSPLTAQHFLTYRWDKTSVADGTFWIQRIPKPILLVRDQSDGVVQAFEPYMLMNAAKSEGSLNTSASYVLLPDPRPPSFNGHLFIGSEQPLADVITRWLGEQHL